MVATLACTAFVGTRRLAHGTAAAVALAVKAALERGEDAPILIFDDSDARAVEFDLRGTAQDVAARLSEQAPAAHESLVDEVPRGRGRPKLGVVPREVTLLPRHWEWLGAQPGGASVVLRQLVDAARHASEAKERVRAAQEAAHRFMTALAGNLPGYEDALRALYAGDKARFEAASDAWPVDVREYAVALARDAFA
ncbi:DUF2239 family protein [Paraburkholderia denitrificans]|uniref:DUF2239 family protein n=1 Tax=Paraburkholderia denitrificans TaxID=694025 RepID=A0ABW0J8K2_9BURK